MKPKYLMIAASLITGAHGNAATPQTGLTDGLYEAVWRVAAVLVGVWSVDRARRRWE
jgi:hypothetical protein